MVGSVAEVGSWKGRSSHALLCGCSGKVTCIDTFEGSTDPADLTYKKGAGVYEAFMNNVGHFKNLDVLRMTSEQAAKKRYEMVFIDATHSYEEVKADILRWLPLTTKIICGHDYSLYWPGVMSAVDEVLGKINVEGSIWYKHLNK